MRDVFHSGIHPDADALNAFMEGALPEHERAACLAHLAQCARCREVVSPAGKAAAVVEGGAPFWRRLFRPMPVLAAVAAAAMLVVSVGMYRMIKSAEPKLLATPRRPVEPGAAHTLPDRSQPVSLAVHGTDVVAADSAGALFFSPDEGGNWKRVKGGWTGRVVRVMSPPDAPGRADEVFEIVTDPASKWLSADGRNWTLLSPVAR